MTQCSSSDEPRQLQTRWRHQQQEDKTDVQFNKPTQQQQEQRRPAEAEVSSKDSNGHGSSSSERPYLGRAKSLVEQKPSLSSSTRPKVRQRSRTLSLQKGRPPLLEEDSSGGGGGSDLEGTTSAGTGNDQSAAAEAFSNLKAALAGYGSLESW